MAKLWQGASNGTGLNPDIEAFLSSLSVDSKLLGEDIECSIAHAEMLGRQGILPPEESASICAALELMLAEADRLKSEFLSNMSHELRTPLNSVMALSQLMLSRGPGKKPEQDAEYLRIIERNGRHLLNLINDILDLSKIEAGRMELQIAEFSPKAAVARAIETVEPLAREKGLILKTDIGTVPPMISDESKLHQVLLNLLSNAVKFTEQGEVDLTVSSAGPVGDNPRILFVVADTGLGISSGDLPRIFDKFRQVDGSTTRRHGGTGLGLAICQELAHLLGGAISVDSTPGVGSRFTLDLPVHPATAQPQLRPTLPRAFAPAQAPASRGAHGRKGNVTTGLKPTILVVDDDASVRTLLADYLEKEGYRVITAEGGHEGIRLAREHLPFAITLDVLMPDLDGWEVIRQLKADTRTHDIPVIMVSVSNDQATGIALGATSFLIKPVDRQLLVGELQKIALLRQVRHVMVVDDDRATRDYLAATLMERGYRVSLADGGRQALEQLSTVQPDVIVLDLMMPEIDGFQVLEKLRGEAATRDLPVIVATAKDLSPVERAFLDRSAQRTIAKGAVDSDQILKDLETVLHQLRRRGTMGNMDDRRIVLVVEDNDVAALQIRSTLEDHGYVVMVARSGTEAMECIERSLPDALILDLMMPGMDGFQVLDTIRATAWTAALPVLVLTAKELTQAERDRLCAGKAEQLLQKGSVDRDQLVENVRRLFEPVAAPMQVAAEEPAASQPAADATSASPRVPRTKTVLIVEDHADNLFTIAAILSELGCEYLEARDGLEGVRMARLHRPGLILMDIQLPVLSGVDAASALKADASTADIPIVALTAKTMKGDRERILAAGCDDYVSKPIEPGEIERVVREWLA